MSTITQADRFAAAKLGHLDGFVVEGVNSCPGIGATAGNQLAQTGIVTPLQLFGRYLELADEEEFLLWLKEDAGFTGSMMKHVTDNTIPAFRTKCEQLFM